MPNTPPDNAHPNGAGRIDSYDLAPRPTPPPLPGSVILRESAADLGDAIAADLFMQAGACVRAFGDFHLALSADESLIPLYTGLMIDPRYRALPWKRTHLWLVSERRVDFEDPRSAFREIREIIVDHSDIPPEQAHPIFPLAHDADAQYEKELRETLGWREKGHDRLDYALVALERDGAAAIPSGHQPLDAESGRLVRITGADANGGADPEAERESGEAGPGRVSLTIPFLNASRLLAIVAIGEGKRTIVERLARGGGEAADIPAAALRPLAGELRWYLDHAACPQG